MPSAGTEIAIPLADGDSLQAELFLPPSDGGANGRTAGREEGQVGGYPGVLVLHESFGLNDDMRRIAQRAHRIDAGTDVRVDVGRAAVALRAAGYETGARQALDARQQRKIAARDSRVHAGGRARRPGPRSPPARPSGPRRR